MKRWRKLLSSVNLLATLIFLGVLFIMINFIASRRYGHWDLTKQKVSTLSEKTMQTLKTLKDPVAVIVFYQPLPGLYGLIKDELAEYERINPLIKVEYVDPQQDIGRAKQLAQQFQIEDLNLVIFQSGTRHKYLSDTDLAEYDYSSAAFGGEQRLKSFKGEDAFTSAIISVTKTTAPLIWFTTGHGEKSIDSSEPVGLSDIKKNLEQQNMTVQAVTLLERSAVPADVKLIIIAGPTRRFTEQEVALLEDYLERGGRLLAMIDPMANTGLDWLLERWGMTLGMDVVVDPSRKLPFVSAANLLVTTYTEHPIVKQMKTLMTLFPLARSVSPVKPTPPGLTVNPLALTSNAGWGETHPENPKFKFDEGQDLKGPVSIAVASERVPSQRTTELQGSTNPTATRVVAIGDSDFIVNAQLANVGNRDLFLGTIYWLIEQEQLIGIGPRPLESLKLNLTGSQLNRLFWLSLLTMPLCCAALGTSVWWVRR